MTCQIHKQTFDEDLQECIGCYVERMRELKALVYEATKSCPYYYESEEHYWRKNVA